MAFLIGLNGSSLLPRRFGRRSHHARVKAANRRKLGQEENQKVAELVVSCLRKDRVMHTSEVLQAVDAKDRTIPTRKVYNTLHRLHGRKVIRNPQRSLWATT